MSITEKAARIESALGAIVNAYLAWQEAQAELVAWQEANPEPEVADVYESAREYLEDVAATEAWVTRLTTLGNLALKARQRLENVAHDQHVLPSGVTFRCGDFAVRLNNPPLSACTVTPWREQLGVAA